MFAKELIENRKRLNYCYCGLEAPFKLCCQPKLLDHSEVTSPETLVRARFSAYVERNADFLINTTLEEKRKDLNKE